MYQYDAFDQRIVEERAAQFRDQVLRRIDGRLTENEFKPLRLQNGLYMQLHAYMMRIAVPYGLLSSTQVRKLAHIARTYDKGYAHLTTRQNVQLNWPKLEDVPTILDELAEVQMHAIQTSGNCIRNITSDPYAGVAKDEIEDPRPYCEILRQWSTFHPEFAFLPRKFKFAVTGAETDRAAIAVHDVGIRLVRNDAGEVGFAYYVGGGQGRTPLLAPCINPFVKKHDLVSYAEAVLRVYNRLGRRDNKFKARIKILVKQTGAAEFARLVDEEHAKIADGPLKLRDEDIAHFQRFFVPPAYEVLTNGDTTVGAALLGKDRDFARWVEHNVEEHRVPGYAIVNLSVKCHELPPGDITDAQLDQVADLEAVGVGLVAQRPDVGAVDQAVVVHLDALVAGQALVADDADRVVVGPVVRLRGGQVVVLPTTVADDVRRPAMAGTLLLGVVGGEVPSRVGVVVALQHEVDALLLEDGQPGRASQRVVSVGGGREHRLVERHDRPAAGVLAQRLAHPDRLVRAAQRGVAVERDEAHALVVAEPDVLLVEGGSVARHLEVTLVLLQQLVAAVLVVSRRGDDELVVRQGAGAGEPVRPLLVVVGVVDQVASVQRERGIGVGGQRPLHVDGPDGVQADLGVAEVQEGPSRCRDGGRGGQRVPRRPATLGAPHAIVVRRARRQALQRRRVVPGRGRAAHQVDPSGRGHRSRPDGAVAGDVLHQTTGRGVVGAPGDRHRRRG